MTCSAGRWRFGRLAERWVWYDLARAILNGGRFAGSRRGRAVCGSACWHAFRAKVGSGGAGCAASGHGQPRTEARQAMKALPRIRRGSHLTWYACLDFATRT